MNRVRGNTVWWYKSKTLLSWVLMYRHKVLVGLQDMGWSRGWSFFNDTSFRYYKLCNKYNINRRITVSNIGYELYTNRNRRNILHWYYIEHIIRRDTRCENTTAASGSGGATVTSSTNFVAG